jgi:hypothetical protein
METIEHTIESGGTIPLDMTPAGAVLPKINTTTTEATPQQDIGKGSLKGAPPDEFDGTRTNSETFVDAFLIYWKINRNNQVMKEPYSRVLMALSFMKGTKIRDWVKSQMAILDDKVENKGIPYDSEALWAEFEAAFIRAFTNSTRAQDAYTKLKELKMNNEDLDTYISTHGNLVLRAGWAEDGDAAIEAFRDGLKRPLHLAILRRDNIPSSMEEWRNAARREHARWALIKASNLGPNNQKTNRWKQALEKNGKQKDPNAMEVDNTRLAKLTDAEREKLRNEGRCFRCRQTGHMANRCQVKFTPKNGTTKSAIQVVDDREEASDAGSDTTMVSAQNPEMLIRALEGFSKAQRDEFLDKVIQKGEDF